MSLAKPGRFPGPALIGTPEQGRASAADQLSSLGVYVHFPWCLKKCPYCDFLSIAGVPQALPHQDYASAVIDELGRRRPELGPRRLESVFFGGGTPSLWEPRQLGRVLGKIREAFEVADDVEITVECNPTSFDRERARALIDEGVNRVSLGVQSLNAERLAFLGRLHDVRGGLRAVEDAILAGVPRVSADLIFGVHGQSPAEAAEESRTVAELGVEHLSAYALTIEPSTEFGRRAKQRSLPLLPDDVVAESFLAVDEALGRLGFEHYEISNFARAGARSRHNVGYWIGREYLGLGTGAWGTVSMGGERVRYRNTPAVERYLSESWESAELGRASALTPEHEPIDGETALVERILLGLRLAEGLDFGAAARELGVEAWTPERRRAVERLVGCGRLEQSGERLWIPKAAWLFADGTISELM
ncbi:MAG: radical SAM family heme chaperone HemW [Myxococcales bacterium]|nr:radical SAM family heme chaperone HemW [Myxococcales bacterium]